MTPILLRRALAPLAGADARVPSHGFLFSVRGRADRSIPKALAAVLSSIVGTCKHLGIDPFVYLREALAALFALGEKPSAEQLLEWLPDRWLLRQRGASPPAPSG